MGKRRLAYVVRRFHDGLYILLTVEGSGGLIHELERRLRVTEPVIKFLTVRIDEEQKRLDKIKAIKDARRKAPPAPAAVPAETAGEAPACNGVRTVVGRAALVGGKTSDCARSSTQRFRPTTNDQWPTTDFKEHHG